MKAGRCTSLLRERVRNDARCMGVQWALDEPHRYRTRGQVGAIIGVAVDAARTVPFLSQGFERGT